MRENDVREGTGRVAVQAECDLFGANLASVFAEKMAMRADPGFRLRGWS